MKFKSFTIEINASVSIDFIIYDLLTENQKESVRALWRSVLANINRLEVACSFSRDYDAVFTTVAKEQLALVNGNKRNMPPLAALKNLADVRFNERGTGRPDLDSFLFAGFLSGTENLLFTFSFYDFSIVGGTGSSNTPFLFRTKIAPMSNNIGTINWGNRLRQIVNFLLTRTIEDESNRFFRIGFIDFPLNLPQHRWTLDIGGFTSGAISDGFIVESEVIDSVSYIKQIYNPAFVNQVSFPDLFI